MMVIGSVLYGVFLAVLGFVPGDRVVATMAAGGVIAALMYAPSLVLAAQYGGSDCPPARWPSSTWRACSALPPARCSAALLLAFFGLVLERPYPPVFVAIGLIEVVLALAVLLLVRRGRLQAGAATT